MRNQHGGPRPRAGRKPGSGKYGEQTRTVRVPLSMVDEVINFIAAKGYKVPLYDNRVSAGTLTSTDGDVVETINLAAELVKNPTDTYCVRVQGDSMINAGIEEGDILVVNKRLQPRHGDIIVANVDGDSTVKRLLIGKDGIILQPENERHTPIRVTGFAAFQSMGVVTNILKSLQLNIGAIFSPSLPQNTASRGKEERGHDSGDKQIGPCGTGAEHANSGGHDRHISQHIVARA